MCQEGACARSESQSLFQEAFMACCTRLRAQIAVEDDPATNRECCVHWGMLVGKNRSLAQLECCIADRASDLQWFMSYDSEASRLNIRMIGDFKKPKIAHRVLCRRCTKECHTYPFLGKGVNCSCLNYVGGCPVGGSADCIANASWRPSTTRPVLNKLPRTLRAISDCISTSRIRQCVQDATQVRAQHPLWCADGLLFLGPRCSRSST